MIPNVEMGFLWTAPYDKALKADFIMVKEGLFMSIEEFPFSRAKGVCESSGLVLADWDNPLAMGLWTATSPAYFPDPADQEKKRRVICAQVSELLKDAAQAPGPQDDFIQLEPTVFISKAKVSLNAAELFCGMHGMSLGNWSNPLAPLLWTAASLAITDFNERAQHKQVICVVDVTKKEFILQEAPNVVFVDVVAESK
jgi:hypothetical protein